MTPTNAEIRAWADADTGSQKRDSKLQRCARHFHAVGYAAGNSMRNALRAENEAWGQVWSGMKENHIPDLNESNKPLAVAASYQLLANECASLRAEVEALRGALTPFSRDEFQMALGGQIQGGESPMWGRNGAVLTLGDFRRARAAIDAARRNK